MTDARLVQSIDMAESNYGYGDHRGWTRAEREAWHVWAARVTEAPHPIEECDCSELP